MARAVWDFSVTSGDSVSEGVKTLLESIENWDNWHMADKQSLISVLYVIFLDTWKVYSNNIIT